MNVRELIAKLSAVEAEHGDVPVIVETYHGDGWAVDALAWDDTVAGTVALITTVTQ